MHRDTRDGDDVPVALHPGRPPMSSGSFLTSGMLIAPRPMPTVDEIASGVPSSLLSHIEGSDTGELALGS